MELSNKGLKIIAKYEPDAHIEPGHDQIWVGSYLPEKMTDEERKIMEDDGWFEAEESWSHFT